jgi:hypothetical protein
MKHTINIYRAMCVACPLVINTAHYGFIVTLRDRSRESDFAVVHDRISMPRQESAPRKVRMSQ